MYSKHYYQLCKIRFGGIWGLVLTHSLSATLFNQLELIFHKNNFLPYFCHSFEFSIIYILASLWSLNNLNAPSLESDKILVINSVTFSTFKEYIYNILQLVDMSEVILRFRIFYNNILKQSTIYINL